MRLPFLEGRAAPRRRDEGSALVDFVLVSLVLVPLFAGIVQLGLVLYVRNTLAACAQDGARYASDADVISRGEAAVAGAAVERTGACVHESLPAAYAQGITASPRVDAAGNPVVDVRVDSPAPVLGMLGAGSAVVHVDAEALQERP